MHMSCWIPPSNITVLYQVLVLSRVREEGLNPPLKPRETFETVLDGSQPLASNIYSPQELHLLSWLNINYEKMRKTVWDTGGGYALNLHWITCTGVEKLSLLLYEIKLHKYKH